MSLLALARVNYRARLERADLLAQRYPSAHQLLTFYGRIARFQSDFYDRLPKLPGKRSSAGSNEKLRSELNVSILLDAFRDFLSLLEAHSPAPLSAHARLLKSRGNGVCQKMLAEFWEVGLLEAASADPLSEFTARAFLQPYAEFLVSGQLPPVLPMTVCRCPRCNALPLLGVLRPEGDGGKRFLQCSFCSQEWEFRRILCAHCGEEQEQKLPVYVAEQFPHIRVECCETCKHFLRTVDLTKDGHAVPLVDDLAAVPLSLWAEENEYQRIQTNLLGS
jgi:formate dehydrogenase accessory protein FdhE